MNIQEYISSGIVESYVLGLAEKEEQAEFERMCAAHTEVRAAREAFEKSLENAALENAIPPPRNLKSKIFAEIEIESAQQPPTSFQRLAEEKNQAEEQVPVRSINSPRWLAAASIILLIGSTLLNLYFYNQYKSFSGKYDELVAQQKQYADNDKILNTKLEEYKSAFENIRNPSMVQVKMPGVATKENNLATVYWNSKTKDVFLMVNNLPKPTEGKQYQLWAMVDGQPVDAGMVEMNRDGTSLIKMKNIPRAQAFAITLEKTGGSPTPDMTALYVLGTV